MKLYSKYKVKIVFKSGYVHVGWFWEFEGVKKENKITSLNWQSAESKSNFNYMHLESIESIVTLAEKKVFRFKNPLN